MIFLHRLRKPPNSHSHKKDDLLTQIEKTRPRTPAPILEFVALRTGPGRSTLLLMGTSEGIFFTPNLKFAPTERAAAGIP
jgi:hypothetical protein